MTATDYAYIEGYRCDECDRDVTNPWEHADECETGGRERDRVRYERMHSALTGIYAVAEHGLYGNMESVRDAAFALVGGRETMIRAGSWEADLEAQAQAKGWAIVQTGDLAWLREALDGE